MPAALAKPADSASASICTSAANWWAAGADTEASAADAAAWICPAADTRPLTSLTPGSGPAPGSHKEGRVWPPATRNPLLPFVAPWFGSSFFEHPPQRPATCAATPPIKMPLEKWTQEVNDGKATTEQYFVLKNLSERIDELVAAKGAPAPDAA